MRVYDFVVKCFAAWIWKRRIGYKMINKVAGSFQVSRRLDCMINCTVSPICDSYTYRAAVKTCQLNTHDTPLIANSTDLVVDSAWDWFRTTFTVIA